jgi:CheY-like chemotaxis protein
MPFHSLPARRFSIPSPNGGRLLVLDIQMAGLTGRDVQTQLAEAQIRIPIIFITAYDEPTTREQCLADGVFEYFCKPLAGDKLVSAIHAAIDQAGMSGHA